MDKKIEKTIIVKSSVEDDRTITCVGSVEKIDRDNDVVVVEGINTKNYKDNPIVLWAHDQKSLPIAKATKVWKKDGQLNFKLEFAEAKHNPMAPFVYEQLKDGFLNAFSISFMPDYATVSYEEKNKKQIRKINNSELLEISCVPCPANANALIMREYKARVDKSWEAGTINGSDLKVIEEAIEAVVPLDIELEEKTAKIVELENKIKQLECEVQVLSKEKEVDEDDIYKEIFDTFRAGGTEQVADAEQTDLLDEYLN